MSLPRVRFMAGWALVGVGLVNGAFLWVLTWRPATLSESEAVRRAEQFIAANGYTDLPADRSRLVPEPVVFSSSIDEELEMRCGTLEGKAVSAFGGERGWVVYFPYKRRNTGPWWAVVMSAKGRRIHVMHQDAW